MMVAVETAPSTNTWGSSLKLMSLYTKRLMIRLDTTATADASVGVKMPPKMPPRMMMGISSAQMPLRTEAPIFLRLGFSWAGRLCLWP